VKQVDSHQENFEKVIEVEGDEDGGWVDTHHFAGKRFLIEYQSQVSSAFDLKTHLFQPHFNNP